jgi:ABC-type polysaccharide/polyol phosphate export permease
MAASVFVFFASRAFSVEGNPFSLAHNPAVYPRMIAAVLFLLSCLLMYQAIRKGALKNAAIRPDKQKLFKVFRLFLVVLLYVVLLNFGGYIFSSLICIFLCVYVFGGNPRQAVLYSVIITASLYLVFQIGFRIPLPKGEILEYWR